MKLSQERIWKIYYSTAQLYHNILFSSLGKRGLDYLISRNINLKSIKKYMIGFAPYSNDRKFLYNSFVKTFNFGVKELLEANLLTVDISNASIEDSIGKQRIIMPVIENGNIVTFSARTIYDSVEPRYKTIKYDRLGVFNSDLIIGENKPNTIYLCEGILDTISLNQMGFPAIGILGINVFGKEHCGILNNFDGNIVLTLDNDENGSAQSAVTRIGNILYECGKTNIFVKNLTREEGEKKSDVNGLLSKHDTYKAAMLFYNMEMKRFYPSIENKCQNDKLNFHTCKVSLTNILSKLVPNISKDNATRYKCICPFPDHQDTTPSFTIYLNSDSEKYKCFGCGRSGNALKFIMDYYNLGIKDALKKIEEFKE